MQIKHTLTHHSSRCLFLSKHNVTQQHNNNKQHFLALKFFVVKLGALKLTGIPEHRHRSVPEAGSADPEKQRRRTASKKRTCNGQSEY